MLMATDKKHKNYKKVILSIRLLPKLKKLFSGLWSIIYLYPKFHEKSTQNVSSYSANKQTKQYPHQPVAKVISKVKQKFLFNSCNKTPFYKRV